ncbi:MAG: class I SAM-dependent RNA methyltransferase [Leptospiraceae bacterium]|nr:class I SAM-dependent RNA methyltransferase [Leptospiraceae bacterium]
MPFSEAGTECELVCEKWVQNGLCLAHVEGSPVFVHGALPGERVRARIVKSRSQHSFAIVTEVLESAPERVDSDCPVFPACGGCSFRHIDYEGEVSLKVSLLEEHKYIAPHLRSAKLYPSPRNHYRNQVRLHGDENSRGFYALHTNEVVPFPSTGCRNLATELNQKISEESGLLFRTHRLSFSDQGENSSIQEAKESEGSGESGESGRTSKSRQGKDESASRPALEFSASASRYSWRFPQDGFSQANGFLIEPWLKALGELASHCDVSSVYEIFCGAGLIGGYLKLANGWKDSPYFGAELGKSSIHEAKQNFHSTGMKGSFLVADLYRGNVKTFLSERWKKPPKRSMLVANPPRAGLKEKLCQWIDAAGFDHVLYSSCNPQTLNRDLGMLERGGFRVTAMHWFDFFPGTPHCEIVMLLKRQG